MQDEMVDRKTWDQIVAELERELGQEERVLTLLSESLIAVGEDMPLHIPL